MSPFMGVAMVSSIGTCFPIPFQGPTFFDTFICAIFSSSVAGVSYTVAACLSRAPLVTLVFAPLDFGLACLAFGACVPIPGFSKQGF